VSIKSNSPIKGQQSSANSAPIVQAVDQQPTSRDQVSNELLYWILIELRIMNSQLREGFLLKDDPAQMRTDPIYMN